MTWIGDIFHGLRATAFLIGREASRICECGCAAAATQPDNASRVRYPHTLDLLGNYGLLPVHMATMSSGGLLDSSIILIIFLRKLWLHQMIYTCATESQSITA
jgi:hypothetical protein